MPGSPRECRSRLQAAQLRLLLCFLRHDRLAERCPAWLREWGLLETIGGCFVAPTPLYVGKTDPGGVLQRLLRCHGASARGGNRALRGVRPEPVLIQIVATEDINSAEAAHGMGPELEPEPEPEPEAGLSWF